MPLSTRVDPTLCRTVLREVLGPALADRFYPEDRIDAMAGHRAIFTLDGDYHAPVTDYLVDRALATHSGDTVRSVTSHLCTTLQYYEDHGLDWRDCKRATFLHYKRFLRGGPTPRVKKGTYIGRARQWLQFRRYLADAGIVPALGYAWTQIREPGVCVPCIRSVSPDEFRILVATCTRPRDSAFVLAAAGTGMRVSELHALTLGDVAYLADPANSNGRYTPKRVVGKGLRERVVYWPQTAIRALLAYRDGERATAIDRRCGAVPLATTPLVRHAGGAGEFAEPPDAPFWLDENASPLPLRHWRHRLATLAIAAFGRDLDGRPCRHVAPHYLRHFYAITLLSALLAEHVREEVWREFQGREAWDCIVPLRSPMQEVRERLGHRYLETTMVYLDHVGSYQDIVGRAIGAMEEGWIA